MATSHSIQADATRTGLAWVEDLSYYLIQQQFKKAHCTAYPEDRCTAKGL